MRIELAYGALHWRRERERAKEEEIRKGWLLLGEWLFADEHTERELERERTRRELLDMHAHAP